MQYKMPRIKPSDINMVMFLEEQHPELADRLRVVRKHLAFRYGQQIAQGVPVVVKRKV